jgi:hypothetical protein
MQYNSILFGTMFTTPIKRIILPRKQFFLYLFRYLVTFCWISEIASNLAPFIAVFNLRSRKSHLVLIQGSGVDWITQAFLVLPETQRQLQRMCRCVVVLKI